MPDARAACDLVPRLRRKSPDLDLTGLDPGLDAGARGLRQKSRKGAVQPLTRQFLWYFELENLELGIHGRLEGSGRASGILPRFCNPAIVRNRM